MAKNKHKILNYGQKKTLLGGPKEGKVRRAGQRAIMAFRRVVIVHTSRTKVHARISTKTNCTHATMEGRLDRITSMFFWDIVVRNTIHPTKDDILDIATHVSWRSHVPHGQRK